MSLDLSQSESMGKAPSAPVNLGLMMKWFRMMSGCSPVRDLRSQPRSAPQNWFTRVCSTRQYGRPRGELLDFIRSRQPAWARVVCLSALLLLHQEKSLLNFDERRGKVHEQDPSELCRHPDEARSDRREIEWVDDSTRSGQPQEHPIIPAAVEPRSQKTRLANNVPRLPSLLFRHDFPSPPLEDRRAGRVD